MIEQKLKAKTTMNQSTLLASSKPNSNTYLLKDVFNLALPPSQLQSSTMTIHSSSNSSSIL
jgi:hypothetical protein